MPGLKDLIASFIKNSDGLGPECFLVVEDPQKPSTWHLQVKDASGKPDHNLMGAAYAAITSNYRGQSYQGPNKAEALAKLKALYKSEGMDWPGSDNAHEEDMPTVAVFEATLDQYLNPQPDAEGNVTRLGKIFEAGDYPDKSFAMTPDEIKTAVAGFEPVDVDLAHVPSPLRGKLGQVKEVAADPSGKELFAAVTLPSWLDALLEGTGRKVSAEWDRGTKRLKGLAIVREPRVSDAALMAAFDASFAGPNRVSGQFAKHNTASGQVAMQAIHDHAVSLGAVCNPVGMAAPHESSAIQQVHDTSVMHGAACEPPPNRDLGTQGGFLPTSTAKVDAVNSTAMPAAGMPSGAGAGYLGQQIGAAPVRYELNTGSSNAAFGGQTQPTEQRSIRMRLTDYITGKAKAEGVTIEPDPAFSTDPNPAEDAKAEALRIQNAALQAQVAEQAKTLESHKASFASLEAEKRRNEAATFAAEAVQTHRIFPAQKAALTALVERVYTLDGTATFGKDEKATALLLTEFVAGLPDLKVFTTEAIPAEEAVAIFNKANTEDPTKPSAPNQERVNKMLDATPVGRQVLAERAKSNGNGGK